MSMIWLGVLLAVGCGDPASSTGPARCEDDGWTGTDDGSDDTLFGMGDDMPLPLTIQELQQGAADEGRWVAVEGVVTVTPAAASEVMPGTLEWFVQEPAGGAYSGLRVVVGAELVEVPLPGDQVDLVGRIVEHDGFVLLQIEAPEHVTKRGTGALPQPTLVAIAELAFDAPSARQYEGVVVQIAEATVTDDSPCRGEFILEHTVRVDDRFVPGLLVAPRDGTKLSAVRGVFVRASGSYELAPPTLDAVH
jgi:hypothetical protein